MKQSVTQNDVQSNVKTVYVCIFIIIISIILWAWTINVILTYFGIQTHTLTVILCNSVVLFGTEQQMSYIALSRRFVVLLQCVVWRELAARALAHRSPLYARQASSGHKHGQKDTDTWSKSGLSNIVLKTRSKAGRLI